MILLQKHKVTFLMLQFLSLYNNKRASVGDNSQPLDFVSLRLCHVSDPGEILGIGLLNRGKNQRVTIAFLGSERT